MFKLYISILLTIISTAKSIPNHFHPYGVSFGDVILPESDDGSVIIGLGAKIKFFSNDFQKLFVNTNGVISFLFPTFDFVPIKFPSLNPLIAPFWTDLTTLNGGKIFYRESTNINDLKQAKILTTSAGFTSFDPTRVFIITWDKVPAYGISSANSTNTFQTVIAINETSTFLNFNYDSLQIFSKSITIGGNMGDGINFYEFPVYFTRNISNLVSQSNVNVPGKWLLQVDKFNINLLSSLPAPALQVQALEAFVCEGNRINISCPTSRVISIESANFGRTSSNICVGFPYCGVTSVFKNTTCYSDQTNYFQTLCNNKKSCSVLSSSSVFGDPCRGTYKYTDVRYRCNVI